MANGQVPPQGPYFYQEEGKTFFSLPVEMLQGIMTCPHYRQVVRDCEAEGIQVPHHVMARDPQAHMMTSQQYLMEVDQGKIPKMDNHNILKEMADKSKHLPHNQQPTVMIMEFRDFQRPPPPCTPHPSMSK